MHQGAASARRERPHPGGVVAPVEVEEYDKQRRQSLQSREAMGTQSGHRTLWPP